MKCILIVSPGEKSEGASELHRLGYELELYPSTQDLSALRDSREEESAAYLRRPPASAERSHVRSLRASFIRLLEDRRYAGNDLVIFGESDAVPMVASSRLETALRKEMEEHPETDMFRLFHHAVWSPQGAPAESDEILFEDFKTGKTDANTSYVWGTHALVVPSDRRSRVARVFADYRLPTDIALEAANNHGDLKIRVARHNLFYQHGRTKRRPDCKIAACLSSYKRLPDLQRQIWCMMDQNYPNLHVFAAVKGIPEGTYRRTVLPLFEHFIQEGRLTMRLFPNRNQLSNFLDTVRDLDVSGYDLFAKIDDDDVYGRDYFKSVNHFHLHLPPEFSSFYCGPGEYLGARGGYPFSRNGFFGCFGPTLVFSREVLEKLMVCEKNPRMISQISPRLRHAGYGFTEDNFMHMIMLDTGGCNRTRYVQEMSLPMHLVIQTGNASVMRGGLVPGDFRGRNWTISTSQTNDERLMEVRHPQWHDLVRVLGTRARRFERDDKADVLSVTDEEITLKWDCWGVETFKKREDGTFVLTSGVRQETPSSSPRKKVAVLFLATGRYIAFWEEFYAACQQYFLTDHDVHYFLFTDHPEAKTGDDVTVVCKPFYPWPMETLRRFETFLTVQEELRQYDYLYFMNGTLLPVAPIGQEIFPTSRQGLMVTLHPGYYNFPRSAFPYEKNGMSRARVLPSEGKYYVAGGFNGGRAKDFLCMCRELDDSVRQDLDNGVIAVWHDESHLNKYIINKHPLVLSPEYLFPETLGFNQMNLIAFKPKVKMIVKDKSLQKHGGHSWLRQQI